MATSRVLVAGASGTIGQELVSYLTSHGYIVDSLQRADPEAPFYWNPAEGELSISLEGYDAVINLAGANITDGLWTEKRKEKILNSRVLSTRLLVDAMKAHPPRVFISASAVGYYGNTHDKDVDEDDLPGKGFLAGVCSRWEEEALQANTRVVILRMGVVLTPKGGALKKMLTPFKLGLGAVLGSGRQWMSWIGIKDLLSVIVFALETDDLSGPINATSPYPVTNEQFSKRLAKSLGRPCFLRAPAWLLRLLLSQMAEEVLLASTKALPKKLLEAGFEFSQIAPDQN